MLGEPLGGRTVFGHTHKHVGTMACPFGEDSVQIVVREFITHSGQTRGESSFVSHFRDGGSESIEFVGFWASPIVALMASDAIEFRERVLRVVFWRNLSLGGDRKGRDDGFFLKSGQSIVGKAAGELGCQASCVGFECIDRWRFGQCRCGFVGILHRMALHATDRLEQGFSFGDRGRVGFFFGGGFSRLIGSELEPSIDRLLDKQGAFPLQVDGPFATSLEVLDDHLMRTGSQLYLFGFGLMRMDSVDIDDLFAVDEQSASVVGS